ncbi:MAG TPA: hypothetical protein VJ836_01050 [Candidatus Saccharimonadales bacterium]|nr:hypothetical protein [Candidatus Saccharimonadales bacterium]
MSETFAEILTAGGHANSLGRVNEVIEHVLKDRKRLDELYGCLFADDAWVKMRAADALEKICRQHPDWILPYIDRFSQELAPDKQPSIQWHLAQIYRQVPLAQDQKHFAINWLKGLLSASEADWIVVTNAMDTLMQFTQAAEFSKDEMIKLLKIQQLHKSKSVARRATKLLNELLL